MSKILKNHTFLIKFIEFYQIERYMSVLFTCIINKTVGEQPNTSSNDGIEGFKRNSPRTS